MLKIIIPETEQFNETDSTFFNTEETELLLEHSLISISKWESKWKKPFNDNKEKTDNSILYSHEEEVRLDRERIKKEKDDTIKEVMSYFEATFKDILTSNEMSVMKENIMALNNKTEIKTAVSRRLNGVTSKDLYHLARNIGKRLGCSNMQIAHFIKKSFQLMLEDTEILTISSKLTCNEGRFTIKIIPIGTPLVAQSLPFSKD